MRAEELIIDIYRQRSELAGQGVKPGRVVMSAAHYKMIQAYHSQLGELATHESDYVDAYRIFNLEICVQEIEAPRVVQAD